jgi:hypothetical protein
MPDLSTALPPELEDAFLRVVDVEGKLIAALEDLGPIAGRDVVLVDAGRGHYANLIREIGARVTSIDFSPECDEAKAVECLGKLTAGGADVVVAIWSERALPGSPFLDAASRLVRSGGHLLIVHDYGRDDVWKLRPDRDARMVEWSHRKGPFLGNGYRIRVIHCWWTFESIEQARDLLEQGFGPAGVDVAERMKRPRLEYQVAIYHRPADGVQAADVGEPRPQEVIHC